ncbi:MAG TPA: hypothetical protein VJ935_08770 [Acidimicrobiia bacterium]|nr:hypothetical protein [Acidimicrobiia bacterium]
MVVVGGTVVVVVGAVVVVVGAAVVVVGAAVVVVGTVLVVLGTVVEVVGDAIVVLEVSEVVDDPKPVESSGALEFDVAGDGRAVDTVEADGRKRLDDEDSGPVRSGVGVVEVRSVRRAEGR